MIDRIIENVLSGRRPSNINLVDANTTPLIRFLSRRKIIDDDVLRSVDMFVRNGASLTLADHDGMTPFYILVSGLGHGHDDKIVRLLLRNAQKLRHLPHDKPSPLNMIMNHYKDNRLHDRNHPIRRLLRFLLSKKIIVVPDDTAICCIRAIRLYGYSFVHDVLESIRLDPRNLELIMIEIILDKHAATEALAQDLLEHGAPISDYILEFTAYRRRHDLLDLFLSRVPMDRRNHVLDLFIRAFYNEPWKVILPCLQVFFRHGATASPDIMRMLVSNNKLPLIRALHDHGTPLALPTQVPQSIRSYNWVRKEMQRATIIQSMITHDLPIKKPRRNQPTWKSVARRTSQLPPDLLRQLRSLF